MRKTLSLIVLMLVCLGLLTGCGAKDGPTIIGNGIYSAPDMENAEKIDYIEFFNKHIKDAREESDGNLRLEVSSPSSYVILIFDGTNYLYSEGEEIVTLDKNGHVIGGIDYFYGGGNASSDFEGKEETTEPDNSFNDIESGTMFAPGVYYIPEAEKWTNNELATFFNEHKDTAYDNAGDAEIFIQISNTAQATISKRDDLTLYINKLVENGEWVYVSDAFVKNGKEEYTLESYTYKADNKNVYYENINTPDGRTGTTEYKANDVIVYSEKWNNGEELSREYIEIGEKTKTLKFHVAGRFNYTVTVTYVSEDSFNIATYDETWTDGQYVRATYDGTGNSLNNIVTLSVNKGGVSGSWSAPIEFGSIPVPMTDFTNQ